MVLICSPASKKALANVTLICEAVNSFQRLKDSNRELIEALELMFDLCEWIPKDTFTKNGQVRFLDGLNRASEKLEKAKQTTITI